MPNTNSINFNIRVIFNLADSFDIKIWIVGGALRDYLINQEVTDIDFVINEDVNKLKKKL